MALQRQGKRGKVIWDGDAARFVNTSDLPVCTFATLAPYGQYKAILDWRYLYNLAPGSYKLSVNCLFDPSPSPKPFAHSALAPCWKSPTRMQPPSRLNNLLLARSEEGTIPPLIIRSTMRTRTQALSACLLALFITLPSLSAQARPGRGPRVRALQGLLLDLARVEISNVEREDPSVERAVQQQLDQARRQLLGAVDGSVPFIQALRFTQRSLRVIATFNYNSYYEDEEVQPRMQQQLDQLGQRVEQLLATAAAWSAGGPPPGWQPPPGWGTPSWSSPPQPPPGWNNRPPQQPPPPPGWNNQPPPPPAYGQQGGVIGPDRFAKLVNQVREAAFQDAQLNVIRDTLTGNIFFTCQQIAALMSAVSFDSGKVEIGALLFPRAVDPQNFSDLTGALTFESYRQQLRQRLGR